VLLKHQHQPVAFDPGHCQDCARDAGLLDHFWHVQREEQPLLQAHGRARQARQYAIYGLWSSGVGMLLSAISLLTG
jgi:hypothetical protein